MMSMLAGPSRGFWQCSFPHCDHGDFFSQKSVKEIILEVNILKTTKVSLPVLTTAQTCLLLKTSPPTLNRWGKQGLNEVGRIARNQYDLQATVHWWVENIFQSFDDSPSIQAERQRYEKYRAEAYGAAALVAEGHVERQDQVVHLQVSRLSNMFSALAKLPRLSRDFH